VSPRFLPGRNLPCNNGYPSYLFVMIYSVSLHISVPYDSVCGWIWVEQPRHYHSPGHGSRRKHQGNPGKRVFTSAQPPSKRERGQAR
jgi:hypothetical protein